MSALPLLARLGDASTFPKAVRAYESDPWGYLRRKLEECESPLRTYKQELYDEAKARLLRDLEDSFLKPGALLDHKETFEKLLPAADFADLSFQLEPGRDPAERREGVGQILAHAKPKTLWDVEKLPPERRGKPWLSLVEETHARLELDRLKKVLDRKTKTEFRRAMVIRRLRRNLGDYLSVTRGETGMRDDLTLFVLTRVEAAIAAVRRFVLTN